MIQPSSFIQSPTPPGGYVENTPQPLSCQEKSFFSNKYHKRYYSFKVYENCVEFNPPVSNNPTSTCKIKKRGRIFTFTKRSRFRLFRILSKIDSIDERNCMFFTLTYHYGFKKSPEKFQLDLHNFLTRVRLFDPGCQYIWRLEFQKRGAPHFHFIFFPNNIYSYSDHKKYIKNLSKIWHSISDPDSKAHSKYGFKLDMINNYSKACAYLSKYIAKVNDSFVCHVGFKHYGNSHNLPCHCFSDINCSVEVARVVIEKLRKWLVKKGKNSYIYDVYFNIDRPQTIFIHNIEFDSIFSSIMNKNIEKDFCYCGP